MSHNKKYSEHIQIIQNDKIPLTLTRIAAQMLKNDIKVLKKGWF
jgi:hypothetical protein